MRGRINRVAEEAALAANDEPVDKEEPDGELDAEEALSEPAPEMEDEEDEPIEVASSRMPVLIDDTDFRLDQDLAHARSNMPVPILLIRIYPSLNSMSSSRRLDVPWLIRSSWR